MGADGNISALLAFDTHYRTPRDVKLAGVDEAGRGPLAGPVVAACCHAGPEVAIPGVDDSKRLSKTKRESLYQQIITQTTYSVGIVSSEIIDQINILEATKRAMSEAIVSINPDFTLIDGLALPSFSSEKVIKGDQKSFLIACASIIAKCVRDQMMQEYHLLYPGYGFDKHKGYGTAAHKLAIQKLGPTPIHRRTFRW